MKHICKTCVYFVNEASRCELKDSWEWEEEEYNCWRLHPRYIIIPCAVVGAMFVAVACILWGGVR